MAWIGDWLVGKLVQSQLVQFANKQWRGLGRQEISLFRTVRCRSAPLLCSDGVWKKI